MSDQDASVSKSPPLRGVAIKNVKPDSAQRKNRTCSVSLKVRHLVLKEMTAVALASQPVGAAEPIYWVGMGSSEKVNGEGKGHIMDKIVASLQNNSEMKMWFAGNLNKESVRRWLGADLLFFGAGEFRGTEPFGKPDPDSATNALAQSLLADWGAVVQSVNRTSAEREINAKRTAMEAELDEAGKTTALALASKSGPLGHILDDDFANSDTEEGSSSCLSPAPSKKARTLPSPRYPHKGKGKGGAHAQGTGSGGSSTNHTPERALNTDAAFAKYVNISPDSAYGRFLIEWNSFGQIFGRHPRDTEEQPGGSDGQGGGPSGGEEGQPGHAGEADGDDDAGNAEQALVGAVGALEAPIEPERFTGMFHWSQEPEKSHVPFVVHKLRAI